MENPKRLSKFYVRIPPKIIRAVILRKVVRNLRNRGASTVRLEAHGATDIRLCVIARLDIVPRLIERGWRRVVPPRQKTPLRLRRRVPA